MKLPLEDIDCFSLWTVAENAIKESRTDLSEIYCQEMRWPLLRRNSRDLYLKS